jgi:hypothetical protein
VDALRKEGHECVEFELPNGIEQLTISFPRLLLTLGHFSVEEALRIMTALMSSDSYRKMTSNLGSDPMVCPISQMIPFLPIDTPKDPSMWLPVMGSRVPFFLKTILSSFVKYILRDPVFSSLFSVSGWKSAAEYVEWTAKRNEFEAAFYEQVYIFFSCANNLEPNISHCRCGTSTSLMGS